MNEKKKALRVLQDVSETSLTRAIEESLAAYQVSLAQRLPGGEVYDSPDFLWVTTGVPIDFYNGVFRCHLDPLRVDARITEIMEEFRRRRLPMYWQVGPSSQPADLRHRLLAHGFLHVEDEPGMALDLLAMNEDFSTWRGHLSPHRISSLWDDQQIQLAGIRHAIKRRGQDLTQKKEKPVLAGDIHEIARSGKESTGIART